MTSADLRTKKRDDTEKTPRKVLHHHFEIKEQLQPQAKECSEYLNFRQIWEHSIEDNNLTLYGFQRFKTSHILNLRYLEKEIAQLDREIYQIGLKCMATRENDRPRDRLALRFSKRDDDFYEKEDYISSEKILRLRSLLKDYGMLLYSEQSFLSR